IRSRTTMARSLRWPLAALLATAAGVGCNSGGGGSHGSGGSASQAATPAATTSPSGTTAPGTTGTTTAPSSSGPSITVTSPQRASFTTNASCQVTGTVTDTVP